jgi:hypothetical protein
VTVVAARFSGATAFSLRIHYGLQVLELYDGHNFQITIPTAPDLLAHTPQQPAAK